MTENNTTITNAGASSDAATANAGGTPTQAATWYDSAPDKADLSQVWQSKKWDAAKPDQIAIEATRAYAAAQKLVGAPPSEVVRYNPENAEVMKGFYGRIGVPSDPTKYDFNGVKLPSGEDLDQAFTDATRKIAFDHHLTPQQARGVVEGLIGFVDSQDKQAATEADAAIATERANLQKQWGNDWNTNVLMAREGALALKFDPEVVGALEKVGGYAKVMEALRSVGQRLREPGAVGGNPAGGNGGAITREQAISRKQELTADAAWRNRWYSNGVNGPEAREMQRLDQIIAGARG